MRALLVAATVAVAVAAALFLTVPWRSSPSFLAQAEAALTPPEGTILHARLVETTISTDPVFCSGTRTAEIWVDQRTHRFRGVFRDPFSPYPFRYFRLDEIWRIPCMRGSKYEAGGREGGVLLRFVPPNRLVGPPDGVVMMNTVKTLDPVADLRRAIRSGRAHDEGKTNLDGREVERIRWDPWDPCDPTTTSCPEGPGVVDSVLGGGYAYVDPETFYPVEIRQDRDVTRFVEFEYLPRTAANLALTNIRAQHPRAIGP